MWTCFPNLWWKALSHLSAFIMYVNCYIETTVYEVQIPSICVGLVSNDLNVAHAYVCCLPLALTFGISGHLFRYYRLISTSRFATPTNAEQFGNPCMFACNIPATIFAVAITWSCGKDSGVERVKWLSAVLCGVKLYSSLGLLTLWFEMIVMFAKDHLRDLHNNCLTAALPHCILNVVFTRRIDRIE